MPLRDRQPRSEHLPAGSSWRFSEDNHLFNPSNFDEYPSTEISIRLGNFIDEVSATFVQGNWTFTSFLLRKNSNGIALIYTNPLSTRLISDWDEPPFRSLIQPDIRAHRVRRPFNFLVIQEDEEFEQMLDGTNLYTPGVSAQFNTYTEWKKQLFTKDVQYPRKWTQTGVAGLDIQLAPLDVQIATVDARIDAITERYTQEVDKARQEIDGIKGKIVDNPIVLFDSGVANK